MTNRKDRYNYSFFEKKSQQINNMPNEDNSPTGIYNTKVATTRYNEFPHYSKTTTPHSSKTEYTQELAKECKRLAVLYPFLSKSQIRSKARKSLSNVSKTTPRKRQHTTAAKGKAALTFINEPRSGSNKAKGNDQARREEESKSVTKPKTHCKSKNKRQRLYDYDDDDSDASYDETDNDDDDPDYHPSSIDMDKPKPIPHKTKQTEWPKSKKASKTSEKNSAYGYLELGEISFSTRDEYQASQKQPSSNMKPIKFSLRKAQTPTIPAVSMRNKTYTVKDEHKDAVTNKSKEVSFNQTVEALNADKLIIDESAPQTHVSESPDTTTGADVSRKSCEEMNSAKIPAMQHSVTVPSSPIYAICSSNANGATEMLLSHSDEEIFFHAEKQPPKPPKQPPKFSMENGYEVITLSSDSEDDDTSTVRSISHDITCRPISSNQIKVEKNESNLPNTHTSVKEQPKKCILINSSTIANTSDPRNKISQRSQQLPMPRGILRRLSLRNCQVSHVGAQQMATTAQTPKQFKCQSPLKEMKDEATQMTPPQAGIQKKIRAQMKDKASEVNMDDEMDSESSGFDSTGFIPKPFQAMREAFSIQQQKNDTMSRFEKPIFGKAGQFQHTQIVTPKLCSVQTQTDSSILRDRKNCANVYNFLTSPPLHQPVQHFETPRKRYVSWKEDRVLNLVEDNAAESHENKEKHHVVASKRESDHDSFLHSMKLELELLVKKTKSETCISNDKIFGRREISYWHVSSPESEASVQEIPLEGLAKNGIQNAAEDDDLANAWCNMFNSPIRSHSSLNYGESKVNRVALQDIQTKNDSSLNSNAAKNTDKKNQTDEQGPTMLSLVNDSPILKGRVNSNISNIASFEDVKSTLPELDSQESSEVTYSSTSSDEILSSYEENWEVKSEASSLTNSPLDLGMHNDKFAIEDVTSTPAFAPTELHNPRPSLLESLLEKMRTFGQNSITNEKSEQSLLTLKCPPFKQCKVSSEPQQKIVKTASPCITFQDSDMSSKRILARSIPKSPQTPRTPQNAVKNAYGVKKQALDLETEIFNTVERSKTYAEEITAKKDSLLCDLFDAATPKSAGGTLNQYLGYCHQFHSRSVFDEDCLDVFD